MRPNPVDATLRVCRTAELVRRKCASTSRGFQPTDFGRTDRFGLGLARSRTDQIDGPWEKFPGNPILVGLPGNIGLGHADWVVVNGQTLLYTSLNGATRSRLALVWN